MAPEGGGGAVWSALFTSSRQAAQRVNRPAAFSTLNAESLEQLQCGFPMPAGTTGGRMLWACCGDPRLPPRPQAARTLPRAQPPAHPAHRTPTHFVTRKPAPIAHRTHQRPAPRRGGGQRGPPLWTRPAPTRVGNGPVAWIARGARRRAQPSGTRARGGEPTLFAPAWSFQMWGWAFSALPSMPSVREPGGAAWPCG